MIETKFILNILKNISTKKNNEKIQFVGQSDK